MAQPTPATPNALVRFLASGIGRLMRIIVGLVLIVLGLFVVGDTAGWILAILGLVPLAAGLFDVCLIGPLFGVGFRGRAIRTRIPSR